MGVDNVSSVMVAGKAWRGVENDREDPVWGVPGEGGVTEVGSLGYG
jgi:hypothetical protein